MDGITSRIRTDWILAGLLFALLLSSIPLLLSTPLTADPIIYDLQARCLLEGGTIYRDVVEPNLPGIIWLHVGIRSLFGWTDLALRIVDLVIVSGVVLLLIQWHRRSLSRSIPSFRSESLFLALMLFWFYLGTSEWCHAQRDTWMFLPALTALYLRRNQILRRERNATCRTIFAWGCLEGVVWAIGFWIKPFIAFAAIASILVGIIWQRKWRSIAADTAGIITGGLLIGGVGTFWLVESGTWPHFWTMLTEWNPTYFEVGQDRWTWDRMWRQQGRFFPFSLCHLFALPWALYQLLRLLRPDRVRPISLEDQLLGAVYLGWLLQSFNFQHLFDYIHVPELFLAVTITIRNGQRCCEQLLLDQPQQSPWRLSHAFAGTWLLLAVLNNPAVSPQRLQHWEQCVQFQMTPEIKCDLQHAPMPDWVELQPALDYLDQLDLEDGQLTVHNVFLVHVYKQLGLQPSTRFVYLDMLSRVFKQRGAEIAEHLDQSGHRYVLSSLLENGMDFPQIAETDPTNPHTLPPQFPQSHLNEFPYNQPVVFRSGQYVIHRVSGPAAPINSNFLPLSISLVE